MNEDAERIRRCVAQAVQKFAEFMGEEDDFLSKAVLGERY